MHLGSKIRSRIKQIRPPGTTRKIDFLIAGTQKGGTSALNAYLGDHPQICMACKKEVHFFDNEQYFQDNAIDYSMYHSFFYPKPSHKLLGEATGIYMYWHDSPRRIWQYNPNMKIIIILRNPIERAYSHWNMQRDRKIDNLTFWDAIQSEQERCREALPYQHRKYSYVDRGFYVEQLRRIWRYFPKNQTLILRNEHLKARPQEILQEVYHFLEVHEFQDIDAKIIHSRPYISSMTSQEKAYLRHIFEYEIRNLERVLGWDCSNWLGE
jgi:hypothetical protein